MNGGDRPAKILVSAASRHGATQEIAQVIADELALGGLHVDVLPPEQVSSIDRYGAVVLGSAVYMGHWLNAASEMVERQAEAWRDRAVWLFSSGPIGDPAKPEARAIELDIVRQVTGAREHRVFAGKLFIDELQANERVIASTVSLPEGDFRDWPAIRAWARDIAQALGTTHP